MEELSYHILDLARNSLDAGATVLEITISEQPQQNLLEFEVLDNGCGVDKKNIPRLTDPFFTTKQGKKIGLGLPLLAAAVKNCTGSLKIHSLPGKGTKITASFPYRHLDRAPLGDLPGTLSVLFTTGKTFNLIYRHRYKQNTFILDTKKIRSQLGLVPLETPAVLTWLKEYLDSSLKYLRGGEKFEILRGTEQPAGKTPGRYANPGEKS